MLVIEESTIILTSQTLKDKVLKPCINITGVPKNDLDAVSIKKSLHEFSSALATAECGIMKKGTQKHQSSIGMYLNSMNLNMTGEGWEKEVESPLDFDDALHHCEQVSLRSACLDEDDELRGIGLSAAVLAKSLFELGLVFQFQVFQVSNCKFQVSTFHLS